MKYFVAGTTTKTTTDLTKIHRNTVVKFFHKLQMKIAHTQQNRSEQFSDKIELSMFVLQRLKDELCLEC